MNATTSRILSQSLSKLTYNGDKINTPRDNHLNIYMGIGLWSKKDKLSIGLPIDVMQMLLSATVLRSQVKDANPLKESKVIILIADSMAIEEGAEREKVAQLTQLYKKSLEPLLDLLNIRGSEIILSSDLEKKSKFWRARESVEASPVVQHLKIEDPSHSAYISTQTSITRYMYLHKDVGVKVGWICADSSKQINTGLEPTHLKNWDELKFDRWCGVICPDPMQYLYAKAGLKQSKHNKHVNISEGCPYTAYSKDNRYVLQTNDEKDLDLICPVQRKVRSHWSGVAEICSDLMQHQITHEALLPKDCINKSNEVITVAKMLNHWMNIPVNASKIIGSSPPECPSLLPAPQTKASTQRKLRCVLL